MDNSMTTDTAHLRGSEEERRGEIPAHPRLPRSHEEIQRLFHELEVHQIELEMQNEQLHQARGDLEKALARYSDLYNFAPVGYFTIDCDSSIRSANLSGASLLGIERSRLIDRKLSHFIADEDRLLFTEFIKRIFANQVKESCDVSLAREGTTSIFVHIEAAFAPDGQKCNVTLSDITDRKRLEDVLRKQEQFARSVIDGLSDNICVVDTQGRIVITNDSWKTFAQENDAFQGSAGEGANYLDACGIINENDRADIEETISGIRAVIGGKLPIFAKEYPCHSPDEKRWFNCKATPFNFFGANYAVIAHENITARNKIETKLQQALESVSSANNTMNRLLRTVAHEFRTPLGLLTGSTDILDRYWDRLTPDERLKQNEHIRSAARQISVLLDSVISFNQQETDKSENFPQLMDIGETCRSIAAEVETVWNTGHKFNVTITPNCSSALLDQVHFRRILANLLTNAFRYTPPDGSVSLRVSQEKSRLLLEIIDTGIGIPEEDQAQIFNAFFRSRNVAERRGLGLGLSIVRESLSRMNGTITVVSKLGEGTTIRVEIPV